MVCPSARSVPGCSYPSHFSLCASLAVLPRPFILFFHSYLFLLISPVSRFPSPSLFLCVALSWVGPPPARWLAHSRPLDFHALPLFVSALCPKVRVYDPPSCCSRQTLLLLYHRNLTLFFAALMLPSPCLSLSILLLILLLRYPPEFAPHRQNRRVQSLPSGCLDRAVREFSWTLLPYEQQHTTQH